MENISFNALNSLPTPLLSLVYFTFALALLTIGFSVYLKITQNWYKAKWWIVLSFVKAKSLIRKWFLRPPMTRYNMVDYPSSEPTIQSESLGEQNHVQPLSETDIQLSETPLNNAEQITEQNGEKMVVKKPKYVRTTFTDIS